DRSVSRRLLEKLEESIGRHVGSLLGHHPLCVPDDEDFPPSDRGGDCRSLDERTYGGHINPLGTGWRRIQSVFGGALGDCFRVIAARGVFLAAQQLLCEPNRQPLFPYSARPL